MEKQKEEYEKKALEAIQKVTEENSDAQSKLQNLQVSAPVDCLSQGSWSFIDKIIYLSTNYYANIIFSLGGTTDGPGRVGAVAEAVWGAEGELQHAEEESGSVRWSAPAATESAAGQTTGLAISD